MYNHLILEIKYIQGERLYLQMYSAVSTNIEKMEMKDLDTTIYDTGADIHAM